jgi:nucleoside-diphosphate-sugar epimerase
MNLVHVRDVAGQLLHVALHGEPGERYNLYGGEAVRQGDFANAVASTLGSEVRVMEEAELVTKYGKTIAEALTSSIPLSTKHGDWKARYSLKFPDWRTMVEDVVANYLRNS